MRRLVPVGLFSVMAPALLALPVATGPSAPAPKPVPPAVESVPVAGVDPVAAAEDAEPASGGKPLVLTQKKATRPFTTLGVTWQSGSGSSAVTVLVRTRGKQGWSSWTPLEVADDDGPDEVSPEAAGTAVRLGTVPQWVGEADGVQVKLDVPDGPAPRDVRVELIDPGEAPADASLGKTSAPRSTATAATSRPAIITRAQWGADERLRGAPPAYASTVKVGYVNHTASTNDYTAEQAAAQVRGFYAYHTKSLGWSDIGYNFLVDKFGRIYEGRAGGVDKAVIGAHAGGFNTDTTGVAMIGTYTSVAPSTATVTSLQDLLAWKLSMYGRDPKGKAVLTSGGGSTARYAAGQQVTVNVIAGHRDTNATVCPGDLGYSKLPEIRQGAADRIAGQQGPSAIDAKHAALGGNTGFLGAATTVEGPVLGGRNRHYQKGSIYWSPSTGANEVHGPIRDRWAALDWERSVLGLPTTDQLVTPNGVGRVNHFQRGSIFWTPGTGAQEVTGSIRDRWAATGWENGRLGFPTTGELRTPNGVGRVNHFQGGSIFWTPGTGAQEVTGAIRDRWAATGWENGPLGFPTTGEYDVLVGRASDFEHGSIIWTRLTGLTIVSPLG